MSISGTDGGNTVVGVGAAVGLGVVRGVVEGCVVGVGLVTCTGCGLFQGFFLFISKVN